MLSGAARSIDPNASDITLVIDVMALLYDSEPILLT
jgi:hypothetical protein